MKLKKLAIGLLLLTTGIGINAQNSDTASSQRMILMVQSHAPHFMREGDKMEFSTRITNMSTQELTGQVTLELIDATTHTSVDGWFQNIFPAQYFTIGANESSNVKFPIQIPFSFNRPLIWRIIARSGSYVGKEENVLPVLSSRPLVTENFPFVITGDTEQVFTFDKLIHQNSASATNESVTVAYSSNPVWYAIQALPYLKQGDNNCSEQIFNRFYANALAAYMVRKYPAIKAYYEEPKSVDSMLSKLRKNGKLKQIPSEDMPWTAEASNELEQQQDLAELFDPLKLVEETNELIEKLQELQLPDGSFSWFKGGNADPYITIHLLTGIGKLKKLGAISPDLDIRINPILLKALDFLDRMMKADYERLLSTKADLSKQQIGSIQMQYLYMRSFFADRANAAPEANHYFLKQGKQFWNRQSIYFQSMLALIYHRNKDGNLVNNNMLPAILSNAVADKQKGLYWKTANGYKWNESSMATQLMLIELAEEMNAETKKNLLTKNIAAMKTWLLFNWRTNNPETSIATANACYALLLNDSDWVNTNSNIRIQLGNMRIDVTKEKMQAHAGYFVKRIDGRLVQPEMGNITVITSGNNPSKTNKSNNGWGSISWQYFEDRDKITGAATPFSVSKKLMVEKNTDGGKILVPVAENTPLKPGDKVLVRLEIHCERPMEYLRVKDPHASCMKPVNTASGYQFQHGLGYYENTTNVSTNFFISRLNKGSYVFEYPLFIEQGGNFSAGMASIQCMYAPALKSYSQEIKINVED